MKTVQWQSKLPGDTHWLNIPEAMVSSLRNRGYQVRELVPREDAEQAIEEARESAIA